MFSKVVVLCITAVLMVFSGLAVGSPNYNWYAQSYQGDVWFTLLDGTTPKIDFRLGGGGSIAEMRNAAAGYTEMLPPPYASEHTDRVLQHTFWVNNVLGTTAAPDKRFNINLAGDSTGAFARICSLAHSTPASGTRVDVYSVTSLQFYPQLNADFAGSDPIPTLTRYELLANGVLKVRRIVRVPNVLLHGVTQSLSQLYFENWNTIGRSGSIDSMALGLDSSGNPNWWYSTSNFPYYQNWSIPNSTNGYAVGFKNGAALTQPVVGFSFGLQPTVVQGSSGTSANDVLNSMLVPSQGIAILPATYVYSALPGSIIDMEFRIVPRLASGSEFITTTQAQVSLVAQPTVYGPAYAFTGELATIVSQLNSNLHGTGTQTEHLGAYW
ncbi:MAG TPA: hypothetical protein VGM81_20595 [Burkholderiaceae bacterium]